MLSLLSCCRVTKASPTGSGGGCPDAFAAKCDIPMGAHGGRQPPGTTDTQRSAAAVCQPGPTAVPAEETTGLGQMSTVAGQLITGSPSVIVISDVMLWLQDETHQWSEVSRLEQLEVGLQTLATTMEVRTLDRLHLLLHRTSQHILSYRK